MSTWGQWEGWTFIAGSWMKQGKEVYIDVSYEEHAEGNGGPLCPCFLRFCGTSNRVLVAAAAGRRVGADVRKGLRIARYCAMLCLYAMAGAWKQPWLATVRVKQRALKARNGSQRHGLERRIARRNLTDSSYSCHKCVKDKRGVWRCYGRVLA